MIVLLVLGEQATGHDLCPGRGGEERDQGPQAEQNVQSEYDALSQ